MGSGTLIGCYQYTIIPPPNPTPFLSCWLLASGCASGCQPKVPVSSIIYRKPDSRYITSSYLYCNHKGTPRRNFSLNWLLTGWSIGEEFPTTELCALYVKKIAKTCPYGPKHSCHMEGMNLPAKLATNRPHQRII